MMESPGRCSRGATAEVTAQKVFRLVARASPQDLGCGETSALWRVSRSHGDWRMRKAHGQRSKAFAQRPF
jgi:hypothetical protein